MVTCVCLQSAPLAGSLIFLKVTGHLSETFTLVCCTLSSELLKNNFLTVCVRVYVCIGEWRKMNHTNQLGKQIECVYLTCLTSQMPTSITTQPNDHTNSFHCICSWFSLNGVATNLTAKICWSTSLSKEIHTHSLLAMQYSVGRSRFLSSPCSTEFTEGRWTSCRLNMWD